jgi:hypothetical protein
LVCGADFVCPVRQTAAGDDSWWLLLRCGECGTWHETFARDEAVEALERMMERAAEAVGQAVDRLDRERMAAQVEAFSRALQLDLIDAGDFR